MLLRLSDLIDGLSAKIVLYMLLSVVERILGRIYERLKARREECRTRRIIVYVVYIVVIHSPQAQQPRL